MTNKDSWQYGCDCCALSCEKLEHTYRKLTNKDLTNDHIEHMEAGEKFTEEVKTCRVKIKLIFLCGDLNLCESSCEDIVLDYLPI